MEQVIKTAEVIVPLIVGIVAGFFLKKKGSSTVRAQTR